MYLRREIVDIRHNSDENQIIDCAYVVVVHRTRHVRNSNATYVTDEQ